MRQTTKIRRADVDKAAKHFDEAPEVEPDEVTRKEAIRILGPKIKGMQRKGYSRSQIAEMLTKNGIPMEADLLASYVREASATPSGRARRARLGSGGAPRAGETPEQRTARSAPERGDQQAPPVAGGVARQAEGGSSTSGPARARTETGGGQNPER